MKKLFKIISLLFLFVIILLIFFYNNNRIYGIPKQIPDVPCSAHSGCVMIDALIVDGKYYTLTKDIMNLSDLKEETLDYSCTNGVCIFPCNDSECYKYDFRGVYVYGQVNNNFIVLK